MEEQMLQTQLKVPEGSVLTGVTNKELHQKFGVTILHRHNPYPATETCRECDSEDYRIETDKYICVSGTRENLLKFVHKLLQLR
jgi:hypothetical protein